MKRTSISLESTQAQSLLSKTTQTYAFSKLSVKVSDSPQFGKELIVIDLQILDVCVVSQLGHSFRAATPHPNTLKHESAIQHIHTHSSSCSGSSGTSCSGCHAF